MLSEKGLIVILSISQWTGRKKDDKAKATVEKKYKTSQDVALVTKALLPKCQELGDIRRMASHVRAYVYKHSLPWLNDGSRIIAAKAYMNFMSDFRKLKDQFDRKVKKFIAVYPLEIEKAKIDLNKMYAETEYPVESQLEFYFDCKVVLTPVPDVEDFRITLSKTEKDEFIQTISNIEKSAMKECWHRLYDLVSKAAHRLQSQDLIIRDSLIENVSEMCRLLPQLNITDDKNLESMRKRTEEIIASISPRDCRENKKVRKQAAKALDDISSKMSVFMRR